MDSIGSVFSDILSDGSTMLMALLVFLAAGTLAFSLMAVVRVRGAVKKRTSRIMADDHNSGRALQHSSQKTIAKLIEYTTKHYSTANDENMKVLRRRLVQAGIYDPRAAAFVLIPLVRQMGGPLFWMFVMAAGVVGYAGPSFYIDRRISSRKLEHRS